MNKVQSRSGALVQTVAPRRVHSDSCRGFWNMMRATFFAIGLFVTLWGVGLFFVDQFVMTTKSAATQPTGFRGLFTAMTPERKQVVDPPEWAAFSLISIGTVTMLYSVALPKKPGG